MANVARNPIDACTSDNASAQGHQSQPAAPEHHGSSGIAEHRDTMHRVDQQPASAHQASSRPWTKHAIRKQFVKEVVNVLRTRGHVEPRLIDLALDDAYRSMLAKLSELAQLRAAEQSTIMTSQAHAAPR